MQSRKLQVAVNYLLSIMMEEGVTTVTVETDENKSTLNVDNEPEVEIETIDNPIQEIMNIIEHNADYCVDCMTDENASNPYYLYLMQAYTHFLVANYDKEVPISKAIAYFLLQHNVVEDNILEIVYYIGDYYDIVKRNNFNLFQNESFMLKAKYAGEN